MDSPAPSKRPHCERCLRPLRSCICRWVAPLAHRVEVLVLQHPLEVANAKGSARLLHLSLPHSQLLVGEVFAEADLRDAGVKHSLLLYPDTPQHAVLGVPPAPKLDPAVLQDPAQLRLVVIDGTWRKSRKMLYLNPWLQQLPRLALSGMPASHYRIRKAHRPDQLSTLEATCYALAQLEGEAVNVRPLLDAFDGFVAQQAAYRPD
ncbi:tRNA-uridine aminocarboxypropyltransferase [Rhodoferax sp.]|uniref:tRNA-uridine aminocarboxypropyltransferase n=1 Tax=Rhodoferax sp. TaxID=50421 RepID=UPI00374D1D79